MNVLCAEDERDAQVERVAFVGSMCSTRIRQASELNKGHCVHNHVAVYEWWWGHVLHARVVVVVTLVDDVTVDVVLVVVVVDTVEVVVVDVVGSRQGANPEPQVVAPLALTAALLQNKNPASVWVRDGEMGEWICGRVSVSVVRVDESRETWIRAPRRG
jgi:hypothetical protein